MVTAVLAAAPLSLAARLDRRWRNAACSVIAGIALAAGLFWLWGYGAALPITGFGAFSMNLLSPVFPEQSGLFPGHSLPYAAPEQNDGYNYLGAGLIVLAATALVLGGRTHIRHLVRRHAGLALACLTLTLFAISSRAYAGRWLIYDVQNVPAAIEQLRGTGRFFWPVAYIVLVASVATAARLSRATRYPALLLATTSLQLADVTALASDRHGRLHNLSAWTLDPAVIRPLLARYDRLTLWPPFACGGDFLGDPIFRELSELASLQAIPLSTAYVARLARDPMCEAVAPPLQPGELRVYRPVDIGQTIALAHPNEECRMIAGSAACSLEPNPLASLPPLTTAATVDLSVGQPIPADLTLPIATLPLGWTPPQPEGRWTLGTISLIAGRVLTGGQLTLHLRGFALAPTPGGTQEVTLTHNGVTVAYWQLTDREDTTLSAPLNVPAGESWTVQLHVAHPLRPIDHGTNGDTRPLGFFLRSIEIDAAP